jgi:hypothetical protein
MTLTEEQRDAVAFDLEAARAGIAHYRIENHSNVDTESALKELVDQANLAEDAIAEIERLRAENAWLKSDREFQSEEQAARVQELEGMLSIRTEELDIAHSVARSEKEMHEKELAAFARRIKELEDALVEERAGAIRCEFYDHCEIDLPDAMIRARQELQADGKIGPDAKPRVWQITEERKAALLRAYDIVSWIDRADSDNKLHITAILGMIKEAEAGQE